MAAPKWTSRSPFRSVSFPLMVVVFLPLAQVHAELAVLHATGVFGRADTCAVFNPHFGAIPFTLEATPKYLALAPDPPDGCGNYHQVKLFWNATAFVTAGNCSNFEKEKKAYQAGAKQIIIVSPSGNDYPKGDSTQYNQIHIPVGMILESSWKVIQTLGEPIFVQLYHPHDPPFDPNLVVIWCLAMLAVMLGAYWSGVTTKRSLSPETLDDDGSPHRNDEDDGFHITPLMIIGFVVMICTILLLLYFFYKYLIYVVIALFALASLNGTYDCFRELLGKVPFGACKVPSNNLPYFKRQPEVRMILLFFVCLALVIWWVIVRNAGYAWILQDFLGVCFCISLIKIIKLPNLKISAILLIALLVYDIFFVFITPFFSARGKSVMVEVATGKGSSEQIPMVLRVPKILKSVMSVCERPYSLLGFGDVLLPGLFIGFCHNFDVIARTPCKIYFLASSVGYGIGLIGTFVALLLMKQGQPALLYLVPCVLLSAVLVGVSRGELRSLWQGRVDHDKDGHEMFNAPVIVPDPPTPASPEKPKTDVAPEKQKLIGE